MKLRILFTGLLIGLGLTTTFAQELKTIKEIQTSTSFENDTTLLKGQKIKVRGVVASDPNLYYQTDPSSSTKAYSFWIVEKEATGPQTGVVVRLGNFDAGDAVGIKALKRGQEVELLGIVDYYNGETQLNLDSKEKIKVLGVNVPLPAPTSLTVGDFNNDRKVAKPSGEPYQGCYVSLKDVRVTSVNSSSSRGNFTVTDDQGNVMDVFDANLDMRLSRNGFVKPAIGVIYTNITGFIIHYKFKDDWARQNYVICPFDTAGAVKDPKTVPPSVNANTILRTPVCPKPSEVVNVNAQVTHGAGVEIKDVNLYYAVGSTNTTYQLVKMTGSAGNYTAQIPAQTIGSFVHYYVEAIDINNNKATAPTVVRSGQQIIVPYSYTVTDKGCRISDIQFTSQNIQRNTTRYESGYRNHTVTDIKGVVTASAKTDNLGYCFIQERGVQTWGGINLVGDIANLNVGDSVVIESAIVDEYFGMTYIKEALRIRNLGPVTPITPLVLDLNLFSPDSANIFTESLEGMLVRFEKPKGVYVTNQRLEVCTANRNLCMDWTIGYDKLNPNKGIRVMTGGTSGSRCSKAVGYINDSSWIASLNSGVEPVIVDAKTSFNAVIGIMNYDWDKIRLNPRDNKDIISNVGRSSNIASVNAVIYPNPASDVLQINAEEVIETVMIFDVLGKNVLTQSVNEQKAKINTNHLPAGTYVLKATARSGEAGFTTRVVILK